jgi:beta-xylosidase
MAGIGLRAIWRIFFYGSLIAISLSLPHLKAEAAPQKEFTNPILWEDLADTDVLRVGDVFYSMASNMHYAPGAPILSSHDLVHWRYVGHAVPALDFGPGYDMKDDVAYVRGTWASFLGYRPSNRTFYWGGCIDFKKTYLYTATAPEGPWHRHAVLDKCYYDAGLLVDENDTLYIAYGNTRLHVAQLSPDATQEVRTQEVFHSSGAIGALEGSRFYKVNGSYYIFTTHPPNGEYVLRSTSGPFGPYVIQKLISDVPSPVAGTGAPHQGGIVQTQAGDWYYMAFVDAYPGGRIPVLAPLRWKKDGWPEVQLVDGKWGTRYPLPVASSITPQSPLPGFTDDFTTPKLGPEWEWNHNPDNTKWSAGKGLVLSTATRTEDLYRARNTLTHRILGPRSVATVVMDVAGMKDGDVAGLAMLRDSSAWIGVTRKEGAYRIVLKSGLTMDRHWKRFTSGEVEQSRAVTAGKIWLRATADIRPGNGRETHFSYSLDGKSFHELGMPFVLNSDWPFFMGYRFGIFNYATEELGGSVTVEHFSMMPFGRGKIG